MRRLRPVLTGLVLLALPGCGDGTGPAGELVGEWQLASVSGRSLPTDVGPILVHASTLTLRADNTFLRTRVVSASAASPQFTVEQTGTYTVLKNGVRGDVITLTVTPTVVEHALRSSRGITMRLGGAAYRYEAR